MSVQNSINTNIGALVALRNLNSVNRDLEAVQNRVSTGLRVSSAQEDASVFSVAQGIRGDLKGYEAVKGALGGAKGLTSVSISGVTQVSNLLADIRGKLTQLSDEAISQDQREIYSGDLAEQFKQLRSFLEGAAYNGRNLISSDLGTIANGNNDGRFADSNIDVASNARVIRSVNGEQLTIRANDLLIGTGAAAGNVVDAFQAFARVAFTADGSASGRAATDGLVAGDVGANIITSGTSALETTAGANLNSLVARQFVGAKIAQAALADLTSAGLRDTNAFNADTNVNTLETSRETVFNSALAFFEQEVAAALGNLGADSRAIEFQIDFNTSISDAVEEGLGALVDADLARESARLQALQTKQQLSVQTLAIANQKPTILLSLFQ